MSNVCVYGLVAYNNTPLAEFAAYEGNFKTIAAKMLETMDRKSPRVQSEQNNHVFLAANDDGMVYLVLTEQSASQSLRIAFLDDMKRKWRAKYGNGGRDFTAYSKTKEFGPTIESLFRTYNSEKAQKVYKIKDNQQKAQDTTVENLNLALKRGEKLEVMQEKANKVLDSAKAFHREAKNVRSMMCWQKYRLFVLLGVVIAIVLFLVITFACGGFSYKKCK